MRPARKGPENAGMPHRRPPHPLDASMRPARKGPENRIDSMNPQRSEPMLQ